MTIGWIYLLLIQAFNLIPKINIIINIVITTGTKYHPSIFGQNAAISTCNSTEPHRFAPQLVHNIHDGQTVSYPW